MRNFNIFFLSLFATMFLGSTILGSVGVEPLTGAAFGVLASVVMYFTRPKNGVALEGLAVDAWVDSLKESLIYPASAYFNRCVDYTSFVENDRIIVPVAGNQVPRIFKNGVGLGANGEVPVVLIGPDNKFEITLDHNDVENMAIPNANLVEDSYDKLRFYTERWSKQIIKQRFTIAAYTWAPNADTALSPIIETTGPDDGTGRKRMVFQDIFRLWKKYADIDTSLRPILRLSPQHMEDLAIDDADRSKTFFNYTGVNVPNMMNFDIYPDSLNPTYTAGKTKAPFGQFGDKIASVAYLPDEAFQAYGSMMMHYQEPEKDPILRRYTMGPSFRDVIGKAGEMGYGAIIS